MLSVLKDDKDKSLLRFVDVGPIYVSPNFEIGIDDAIKFFPHDFDEMDGELKTWLAQQSAHEDELENEEEGVGGEEFLEEENNAPAAQQ